MITIVAGGCKPRQQVSQTLAQAQNRYIMGAAADYIPIGGVDADRLRTSMAYRRDIAWEIVARVLEPVPLRSDIALDEWEGDGEPMVHKWVTWYDSQEFRNIVRMFLRELSELSSRERKRCFYDDDCIEPLILRALEQNVDAMNRTFWAPEYFEELLGQLRNTPDITGLAEVTNPSGVSAKGMTLYSPGIVRHYLREIPTLLQCKDTMEALAELSDPGELSVSPRTPCFRNEFPDDAVALKLTWSREDASVADVDTSSAGLRRLFATGNWLPDGPQENLIPVASIGDDRILTMQSRDLGELRKKYVLTGMHIVAKEIPDWMWVSLWWSSDAKQDFGADRPASIGERFGSEWDSYKMCAVGSFEEGDTAPWQSYEAVDRTRPLAEVLKTYKEMAGDYTWCSNHFVEITDGHGSTNCIGCHQHGGYDEDPTNYPLDYPHSDRALRREYFPADYLFSFSAEPDNFLESIQTELRRADIRL